MIKKFLILISINLFFLSCGKIQQQVKVHSPDDRISVTITLMDGIPYYSISRNNQEIIRHSRMGIVFGNIEGFANHLKISEFSTESFDNTWEQPWGEERFIRNHYNKLTVNLQNSKIPNSKMSIVFRAYNDGIAFRYILPESVSSNPFVMTDELTEFAVNNDPEVWWIKAYQWNRYEYLYQHSMLSEIDTVHTPLTMKVSDNLFLSIHEAALTDYSSMAIKQLGDNVLKCDLYPWMDGSKVKGQFPLKTPWRTIQISETPDGLITSYLILNCNEPSKLDELSWIRPAKYIGIWWGMHVGTYTWHLGERHGATTETSMKYIDYATELGMDAVLIEGWNQGWNSDWYKDGNVFSFTEPFPDFDLDKITDYAREKGVKIIGHHETSAAIGNYENQVDDAFQLYKSKGIDVVKTGYVGHGTDIIPVGGKPGFHEWHHGQYMVRHYRKIVEKAAQQHIMLDVHEPIKDTGIRRTYPNMMTREGARGQEYNAWSDDGGNPPDYTTIIPFTRLLAGPMDFTPGIFDLTFGSADRPNNQVNTTLAKQLALYVIIYSPLQMAADLPQNYVDQPAFQFIRDVPVDWETTIVPDAVIGDYITTVRKDRTSDDWYVGSITDENARDLILDLSFLDEERIYTATFYEDGQDADWKTNPYPVEIHSENLNSNDQIHLHMAAGGGTAIRLHPE